MTWPTKRVIRDQLTGAPYLVRWHLCKTRWFRLFLHRILREDHDREPHNHPWPWALSLVLRGGYAEERTTPLGDPQVHPCISRLALATHAVGGLNWIGKRVYHRITSVLPNTYTLFLTGPRTREWGFLRRGEHVDWREYLGVPEGTDLED